MPKLNLIRMRGTIRVSKRKACIFESKNLVQSLRETRLSSMLLRFASLNLSIILSMPKLQLTRMRVKLKVSPKRRDGYSKSNLVQISEKKSDFSKGF